MQAIYLLRFAYFESTIAPLMKVTILGNNSALPAFGRHPTSQTVTVHGEVLMIDCGEGTQIQMQRYSIKTRRLRHIYISHLHGDHYFGLPGLINSLSLGGRTEPLHLYGPAPLQPIIEAILAVADTTLSYPFFFHPLPADGGVLTDNDLFSVTCFPVMHRIACHGFLVESKTRGRRILPEQCAAYKIPTAFYESLKQGADYTADDGTIVRNEWVTEEGPRSQKYAYCADTIYTETFLDVIRGADAIYHESTYLEQDADKAKARYHSTAIQAATIARKAGVQQLLLGHFSSKYKDLETFKEEALTVFDRVTVTGEGCIYEV